MAQGNLFMAHRTGFTVQTLGNALIANGFIRAIVERNEKAFALWAIGFKTQQSDAQLKAHRNALIAPSS